MYLTADKALYSKLQLKHETCNKYIKDSEWLIQNGTYISDGVFCISKTHLAFYKGQVFEKPKKSMNMKSMKMNGTYCLC